MGTAKYVNTMNELPCFWLKSTGHAVGYFKKVCIRSSATPADEKWTRTGKDVFKTLTYDWNINLINIYKVNYI